MTQNGPSSSSSFSVRYSLSHFSPSIGTCVLTPVPSVPVFGVKNMKVMANPLSKENVHFGISSHDACSEDTHVGGNSYLSYSCSDGHNTTACSDSGMHCKLAQCSPASFTKPSFSSHVVKLCFHQQVANLPILPVVSARIPIYKQNWHFARCRNVI